MSSFRAPLSQVALLAAFAYASAGPATVASVSGFLAPADTSSSLSQSLASIYGGLLGTDTRVARRLSAIENSIRPTYKALPKNADGQLMSKGVRHLVQTYFSREHGWLMKGLDQRHMINVTNVHEAVIFKDKVSVEEQSLVNSRHVDTGSSFNDSVALLAVFEHLISQETQGALEAAYERNGFSTTKLLKRDEVDKILQTYLWMLRDDGSGQLVDPQTWVMFLETAAKFEPLFADLVAFESDAVRNFFFNAHGFTNPFTPTLTFEAVSEVLDGLTRDYGKWQQSECHIIKDALTSLDSQGSGRVPLGTFYAQPPAPTHVFSETAEDLRKMGILEETSQGAYVRIVNYLLGPSNCVAHSNYYCVCCLSECEKLIHELDAEVKAPTVETERLLYIVGNMSSESIEAPRRFDKHMTDKLYAIAARNGGEVPLHGRMFAQWLHYAFPHECPYPHVKPTETPALDPSRWIGGIAAVDESEKEAHIHTATLMNRSEAVLEAQSAQWTDEEILPLAGQSYAASLRVVFRITTMIVLGVASIRLSRSLWRRLHRLRLVVDSTEGVTWSKTV